MVRRKATPRRRMTKTRARVARRATRSTAPKARKTTRRRKLTTASSKIPEEVKQQLAVVHNPFFNADQPKIPDGKTNMSLGLKYRAVGEFKCATAGNVSHMFLFPGQCSALFFLNGKYSLYTPENGLVPFENAGGSYLTATLVTPTYNVVGTPIEQYAKWRVVSTGLRMKLLNPQEQDDGWWEAVRMNNAFNSSDWVYQNTLGTLADTVPGGTYQPFPFNDMDSLKTRNLADMKTYKTGRLKDIHQHRFHLHSMKDDVDFKSAAGTFKFGPSNRTIIAEGGNVDAYARFSLPIHSDAADLREACHQHYDDSYDIIYIRMYGTTVQDQVSRLLVEVASNQEIVHDNFATEARYHTRAHHHKGTEEHVKNRNNGGESASQPAPMEGVVSGPGGRRRRR